MGDNFLGIYLEDISETLSTIQMKVKKATKPDLTEADKRKRKRDAEEAIKECQKSMRMFESELKQCGTEERKTYDAQFKKFKKKLAAQKRRLEDDGSGDVHGRSSSGEGLDEENGPSTTKRQPTSTTSAAASGGKQSTGKKGSNASKNNVDIEMEDQQKNSRSHASGSPGTELKQAKRGDVRAMDEIHDVQEETNEALQRIIRLNETTLSIAAETAAKLKEQTEKIIKTQQDLDDMGSEVKRARKELNSFMRQLAKDKIFMVILCLLVALALCLLIAFIVIRIVKPDLLDPRKLFEGGGGESEKTASILGTSALSFLL